MNESKLDKYEHWIGTALCIFLGLLPILAVLAPRGLAFAPGFIGIVFAVIYFLVLHQKPAFFKYGFIWVLTAIIFAFLSCLWSVNPDFSLERALKMTFILLPGLLLPTILMQSSNNTLEKLPVFLGTGIFLGFLILSTDYLFDFPIYRLTRQIPSSENVFLPSLNRPLTALVLLSTPLLLFYSFSSALNSKQSRFLSYATFILLAVCVIETKSQSAQLALIFAIIFFFLFPVKLKAAWIVLAIVIGVFFFAAPFITEWAIQWADQIPEETILYEASIPHRLHIWHFAAQEALKSPFYGHGIEAMKSLELEHMMKYAGSNTILHPHNAVYQIWVEFGAIGIIAAFSLVCLTLHAIRQQTPVLQPTLLAAFMACMSVSVTGYGFWQSWWLGTLLIVSAIAVYLIQINKNT